MAKVMKKEEECGEINGEQKKLAKRALSPLLSELPVEIVEKILFELDGFALRNLKNSCREGDEIVTTISNCDKGLSIWKDAAVRALKHTSNPLLLKIVASFLNTVGALNRDQVRADISNNPVEHRKRAQLTSWLSFKPNGLDLPYATWEYVFNIEHRFMKTVCRGSFRMDGLQELETIMKNRFSDMYKESWYRLSEQWPTQIVLTFGSSLVYVLTPQTNQSNHEQFCIYENMRTLRRESVLFGTDGMKKKIYYCRLEYVAFKDVLSQTTHKCLPKIEPLIVFGFDDCILLGCLPDGRFREIPTMFNAIYGCSYKKMGTPYAIYGNYLAVYENPMIIRILEFMSLNVETGRFSSKRRNVLSIPDDELWNKIAESPKSCVFVLRPDWEFPVEPMGFSYHGNNIDEITSFDLVFNVISPKIGWVQSGWLELRETPLESIKCLGKPLVVKMKDPETILKYGTLLFWDREIFGCAFNSSLWVFNMWSWFLAPCLDANVITTHVDLIANNTVMICTRRSLDSVDFIIHIAKIEFHMNSPKKNTNVYGHGKSKVMNLVVLRKIPLHFRPPHAIKSCQFDFDQGKPYILIITEYDFPNIPKIANAGKYGFETESWINNMRQFGYLDWEIDECKHITSAGRYKPQTFRLWKITFQDDDDWVNGKWFVNDFKNYDDLNPSNDCIEEEKKPGARIQKLMSSWPMDKVAEEEEDCEV